MIKFNANITPRLTVETIQSFLVSKGFSPNTKIQLKYQDLDPSKLELLEIGAILTPGQISQIQARFPELVNVV